MGILGQRRRVRDLAQDKEFDPHDTTSDEEVAARPRAHMIDFVDYRGDLPRVARLTRHRVANEHGRPGRGSPPRPLGPRQDLAGDGQKCGHGDACLTLFSARASAMVGRARSIGAATRVGSMPANLSPEYKAAEAQFRQARAPQDRLHWLREMLRTIPKHKGTDHLQADIKTRIKSLADELTGQHRGAAHGGPITAVRPEGAAQVALIGPPNSGKSALHAALTGSHAQSGSYPFTTHYPQPGMLPFEDTLFQLLDLPPIDPEHPVPWIGGALQQADAALLAVDLSASDCVDQVIAVHEELGRRRVHLTGTWPGGTPGAAQVLPEDPFAVLLPTLLVATKADLMLNLARNSRSSAS